MSEGDRLWVFHNCLGKRRCNRFSGFVPLALFHHWCLPQHQRDTVAWARVQQMMEMLMMIINSDMSHLRCSLKPHPKLPTLTPRFTSYDTYEKEHPVTPPRVSLASLYWQPTVSLDATSRLPHRIRVAVVGVTCHLVLGAGGYVATLPYRCHLGLTFFLVVCMAGCCRSCESTTRGPPPAMPGTLVWYVDEVSRHSTCCWYESIWMFWKERARYGQWMAEGA